MTLQGRSENRPRIRGARCGPFGAVVYSENALLIFRARRGSDPALRPAVFRSRRQTRLRSHRSEVGQLAALLETAAPRHLCLQLTMAADAVLQQGLRRRWRCPISPDRERLSPRSANRGQPPCLPPRNPRVGRPDSRPFHRAEITHQLTGRAIGPLRYLQLPQWVREGYADYVGKGNSFNYREARRAFLAGAPEMDWKRSGLYSRFHLLVAYLLDHRRWSVAQLLRSPPSQEAVEAAVREEKP
jgi:hypothetical protein